MPCSFAYLALTKNVDHEQYKQKRGDFCSCNGTPFLFILFMVGILRIGIRKVALNEKLKDDLRVFYQSVGSKMNYASSGRFPLNMSYPLVKHFDGECDGLVSVESMKWGSNFIYLSVPSGRGISHGDMIDLNRENISGFDVREFYVNLIKDLRERGF